MANKEKNGGESSSGGRYALERYIQEYIDAALLRMLSGEELDGIIGSITHLKIAAEILKRSADVVNGFDFDRWFAEHPEAVKVILDGLDLAENAEYCD